MWLPVKDRITFKLLLITYKSLNDLAPVHIYNELLHHYAPCLPLRSSDSNLQLLSRHLYVECVFKNFYCPQRGLINKSEH